MPRIPYFDVESASGKHAEFLDKLKPHLNIYRMLANSEAGLKGFTRMGNALLHRCELDQQLRELAIEAPAFTDNEKAVLRFTDDVVRNVKASDRNLKAVQAFLSPGAVVELTLTIGYYMMVCRFLETTGVEGEEGQAEWLKTAKL